MYTAFMPGVRVSSNKAPQFVLSSPTILFSLNIIINSIAYDASKAFGDYEGIIFGVFYFFSNVREGIDVGE